MTTTDTTVLDAANASTTASGPSDPSSPAPLDPALFRRLSASVCQLLDGPLRQSVARDKAYQFSTVRRNDLYFRGKQYLVPYWNGSYLDYKPLATGGLSPAHQDTSALYDHHFNLFRGDIRKFVAVLGNRSPNVKAIALDPENEQLVQRTRLADRVAAFLRNAWPVEFVHRHLCLSLAKSGTTYLYTPYVCDEHTYGSTQIKDFSLVESPSSGGTYDCFMCGQSYPVEQEGELNQCPSCSSPLGPESFTPSPPDMSIESKVLGSYPNGCVELRLCNKTTVTHPQSIQRLEDAPWLLYEYKDFKGKLIRLYPELAKYKSEGLRESSMLPGANQAQDTLSSPTGSTIGDSTSQLWLYSCLWLTPDMYYTLPYDEDLRLAQALAARYPSGLKVTIINGRAVGFDEENLLDVWAAVKPETSETLDADAVFEDFIQIQDIFNDLWNIMVELFERGLPVNLFDPMILDPKRINERSNLPAEWIPTKPGQGQDLQSKFFQTHSVRPPEGMPQFMEMFVQKAREITGILPAIFGGDAGSQTAREAELKRNQALMQLNTTLNEIRAGWSRAYENGVKQLAKHSGGKLNYPRSSSFSHPPLDIPNIEQLTEGGWKLSMEESMPMTAGQRRDFFMQILHDQPEVAQMLGVGHPENLSELQEMVGVGGWKVPNRAQRDHVLELIAQLLQSPPIQQLDPWSGAPLPPQPSIPPDPFLFDPPLVVEVVKEWVHSDGRQAEEQNPEGYRNVVAYGMAYFQIMNPPQLPPGPGAGPNGEGEGGQASPPPGGAGGLEPPRPDLLPPPPGPPPLPGLESGPPPPLPPPGLSAPPTM